MIPWINRPVMVVSSSVLRIYLTLVVVPCKVKPSRLSLFHTKFISFDPSNPEGRLMNKFNADTVNINKFSADQGGGQTSNKTDIVRLAKLVTSKFF